MQAYPGTDPVTIIPGTLTPGYGLWPTPQEAQGGDRRQAAQLMAGMESNTDRDNFLAWRVCLLNPIEGSPQVNATFTSAIWTKNAWKFIGSATFTGTGSQVFLTADTMMVAAGKTLNIGDPGGFTLGNVDIWDDCLVKVRGSSGHPGILSAENFGIIKIKSGGTITTDSGGIMTLLGRTRVSASVSATTDPGDDNALMGPMLVKAWGSIHFDGAGNATIEDGYNVASVAVSGTGNAFVQVTFARSMANAHYHVSCSACPDTNGTTYHAQWQVRATGTCSFVVATALNANPATSCIDLNATALVLTFEILGRQ